MMLSKLVLTGLMATASIPTGAEAQAVQVCSDQTYSKLMDWVHSTPNTPNNAKLHDIWLNAYEACLEQNKDPVTAQEPIQTDGYNPYENMTGDEIRMQIEADSLVRSAHRIVSRAEAREYIRESR